nr:MAG TPA: hypothetical protein [Caudoviricetes sp.]
MSTKMRNLLSECWLIRRRYQPLNDNNAELNCN